MKKIILLTSVFFLAACGGTGQSVQQDLYYQENHDTNTSNINNSAQQDSTSSETFQTNDNQNTSNQNSDGNNSEQNGPETNQTSTQPENQHTEPTDDLFPDFDNISKMKFIDFSDKHTLNFNFEDGHLVSVTANQGDEEFNTLKWERVNYENQFKLAEKYLYTADPAVFRPIIRKAFGLIQEENSSAYMPVISYDLTSERSYNISSVKEMFTEMFIAAFEREQEVSDKVKTFLRESINNIDDSKITVVNFKNAELELVPMGQRANLKYSDFGGIKYTLDYTSTYGRDLFDTNNLYQGGIEDKKAEKPVSDMTFNGSAIGYVFLYKGNISTEIVTEHNSMLTQTDHAKLEIKDGEETLYMYFSKAYENPWYDVIVDSNSNSIQIENTINTNINPDFRISESLRYDLIGSYCDFETQYYGETQDNPSEVSSSVSAKGINNDMDIQTGVVLEAIFGGTVQK